MALLDLPTACLMQSMRGLTAAQLLSLFCACKATRDLVLDHVHSISLALQPLNMEEKQMLNALSMVYQHAKPVALHLKGRHRQQLQQLWAQYARQCGDRSCNLLAQGQLMGYLDTVTELEITGAELAMPLMPEFSKACPNLAALCLRDCQVSWHMVTAESFAARFPKLRALSLHSVTGMRPTEATWQHMMLQQMEQLTALRSLHLLQDSTMEWPGCMPLYITLTDAVTVSLAGQLTQFGMSVHQEPPAYNQAYTDLLQQHVADLKQGEHSMLQVQLQGRQNIICYWLQGVTIVQLHSTQVQDHLMQRLLALPSLASVSVGSFQLQESYSGKPCHWKQLAFKSITLHDFARLPFHRNLQLKGLHDQDIDLVLPRQPSISSQVNAADANITSSRWGGWGEAGVQVNLEGCASAAAERLLHQVLPILDGVARLTIKGVAFTSHGMLAFADFAFQQQAFALELCSSCKWAPGDVAEVIMQLPAGSSLTLWHVDDSTISQLCSAAQSRLTLRIKGVQLQEVPFGMRVDQLMARIQGMQGVVLGDTTRSLNTGRDGTYQWDVEVRCQRSAASASWHDDSQAANHT